jgi:hypothetical protein
MTSKYVVEKRSFLSKQKFLFKINANESVIRIERCTDVQNELILLRTIQLADIKDGDVLSYGDTEKEQFKITTRDNDEFIFYSHERDRLVSEIEIARRQIGKALDVSEQLENVMHQRSIFMDGQDGSKQVTLHVLTYGLFIQHQNAFTQLNQQLATKSQLSSSFIQDDSFYQRSSPRTYHMNRSVLSVHDHDAGETRRDKWIFFFDIHEVIFSDKNIFVIKKVSLFVSQSLNQLLLLEQRGREVYRGQVGEAAQ